MVLTTAMGITQSVMVEIFVKENGLPPFALDVLRHEEDCEKYFSLFHGNHRERTEDLLAFKKEQLASSTLTLDGFLQSCYDSVSAKAFEDAFFQSFDEEKMIIIRNAIADKKITLEQIYAKFIKYPKRNIMRQFNF